MPAFTFCKRIFQLMKSFLHYFMMLFFKFLYIISIGTNDNWINKDPPRVIYLSCLKILSRFSKWKIRFVLSCDKGIIAKPLRLQLREDTPTTIDRNLATYQVRPADGTTTANDFWSLGCRKSEGQFHLQVRCVASKSDYSHFF